MQTIAAIVRALRAFYMLMLALGAATFLVPGMFAAAAEEIGSDALIRGAIGLALFGLLLEHVRTTAVGRNLGYIAQRLIRLSPDLRRLEAVKILVNALGSDNGEVAESAHRELKRLTGEDFGLDATAWRQWVREQERAGRGASNDTPS